MGTLPFFHSSADYFDKNLQTKDTSRMRIEHSHFIHSIDEEKRVLTGEFGDKLDQIHTIISNNA